VLLFRGSDLATEAAMRLVVVHHRRCRQSGEPAAGAAALSSQTERELRVSPRSFMRAGVRRDAVIDFNRVGGCVARRCSSSYRLTGSSLDQWTHGARRRYSTAQPRVTRLPSVPCGRRLDTVSPFISVVAVADGVQPWPPRGWGTTTQLQSIRSVIPRTSAD